MANSSGGLAADSTGFAPVEGRGVSAETFRKMGLVIDFLVRHRLEQPSLADMAAEIGLSPAHLQRVFTRYVGVSPKRFLQYLALEVAKSELDAQAPVLEAAYGAGLSGAGRLHDLFIHFEAMTPGEYKYRGRGLDLEYGFAPSPFGLLLCASSKRGIVGLAFADERAKAGAAPGPTTHETKALWAPDAALADLQSCYSAAQWQENPSAAQKLVAHLFGDHEEKSSSIKLHVGGTNFQVRVWEALLRLPVGYTTTYTAIAGEVGTPRATRAVASAVGRNPVSLLIPCHRVLRADGGLGGYHWGLGRKRALLAWERGLAAAGTESIEART